MIIVIKVNWNEKKSILMNFFCSVLAYLIECNLKVGIRVTNNNAKSVH